MHLPRFLFVCLTVSLAPAAPTQQPDAMTPFSLAAPPATAAQIDEPYGDGVFWVRGTSYKARVDAAGVTFVPRFAAAREPSTMRLRYRSAAATRVERDGQALVLRHGATCVERWRTEPQGMEQSFVLATRPDTADFTLHVDVETNLHYRGYDRGLVFGAEGLGEIRYGEGIVFDSAGRRAPIVPEFTGGAIVLHVPAAFLAAAQYPVTIDPFLGSLTVSQANDNDFHPDIVRVLTGDDFVVVFEEVFTSSDHDIVLHRYQADGTFVSRVFLDSTSDTCIDPKVCATGGSSVLAIWDDDGSNQGIQARRYQLANASLGSTAQVTLDLVGVDSRNPDVGGGTTLGVNNFGQMAVWVRVVAGVNASLRGMSLQATGVPAAAEFVIESAPGCDPRPDISPSGGNPLFWGVAWQERSGIGCSGGDIYWAAVNLGGVIVTHMPVDTTANEDDLLPRAFTYDKDTLITYHQATTSFGQDIGAKLFRRSTSGTSFSVIGPNVNLSAIEPGCPRALDQSQSALGFDGARHTSIYMENQRPKGSCLFAGTYDFSEGHASLSATTNNCGAPAVTHVPTPDSPVRYAVVWQEDVGTRFEVRGAFYEARQPGSTVAAIDTGCGTHGFETEIAIDRVPAVGHDFTVSLSNLAGLPLLIVGPPMPAPVLLCGGLNPCKQGIVSIMASVFAPSLNVDLPGSSSFVGMSLAFQGADLGASGGCGTALFGLPFRTTDTLVVTFR